MKSSLLRAFTISPPPARLQVESSKVCGDLQSERLVFRVLLFFPVSNLPTELGALHDLRTCLLMPAHGCSCLLSNASTLRAQSELCRVVCAAVFLCLSALGWKQSRRNLSNAGAKEARDVGLPVQSFTSSLYISLFWKSWNPLTGQHSTASTFSSCCRLSRTV